MFGWNLLVEVFVVDVVVIVVMGEWIGNFVVFDFGVKQVMIDNFVVCGFDVYVFLQSVMIEEICVIDLVVVFYFNGFGDLVVLGDYVELLCVVFDDWFLFFGICFGNQFFGCVLGFGIYKLLFGYCGINQLVFDKEIGKVEIMVYNYGFVVEVFLEGLFDSLYGYGKVEVSYVGFNDNVVEGLCVFDILVFLVQYYLEVVVGLYDVNYFFDWFCDMVIVNKILVVVFVEVQGFIQGDVK